MKQTHLLINTLKKQLRGQGKTYADVARLFDLSESSVKRLFAKGNFSLERMEQLCEFLDLELIDLVNLMQAGLHKVNSLTRHQEQEIVSDKKLLLVTICVLNHWAFEEILEYYHITEYECIQKLGQLDKLKIIELKKDNKFKLLISNDFAWLPDGPIQKFFQQHIKADYLSSAFADQDELLICRSSMLTPEKNALMQKKLKEIAALFSKLSNEDADLPVSKRYGSALVLALRPWVPAIFNQLKKK